MKSLRKTYTINAPVKRVWQALVNPKDIAGWGAGPAKMSAKVDASFSLWGGDIHGVNTEVIPEKKLVQKWYGGTWDAPSVLTIALHEERGGTRIELTHTNIPDDEAAGIDDGWTSYYFGPMKEYLESI